jgi:hypothetical protein
LKVYDRLDPALGKDIYGMKLQIISNNLFGVDIEPMAVEISRLRAWLSLVVDLEVEAKKIKPLPNLDFRFVCANSLIPLDQNDAMMFGEDPELGLKLEEIRKQYFTTESLAKKKKHRLAYERLILGDASLFGESRLTSQLKSYHPFDTSTSASFFDPGHMFGCKDFQIVIGNPPYVRIQNLTQDVSKELSENYSEIRAGKLKSWVDDLYAHFIFRGFDLATENGIVCMITNDSFVGLESKLRVRTKLLQENLTELIRCPRETFGATIYTAIFLASRSTLEKETYQASRFTFPDFALVEKSGVRKEYVRSLPHLKFVYEEDELMAKLLVCKTMGEYIKVVPTGINTGNVREKMFFKEATADAKERVIQGRQIQRWAVHWDSPAAKYKYCNPNYVPKDVLGVGRSGKKSNLKEYWFYARGGDVSNHFVPERLLLRTTSDSLFGAYQSIEGDGQLYTDHSLFTVLLKDDSLNLKYFLGVLNSKLLNYIYQYLTLEEGKVFAEVKMDMVHQLPVIYDPEKSGILIALVDKLIDSRRKNAKVDVSQLEKELDLLVCQIFGLNEIETEKILGLDIIDQEPAIETE